MKNFKVALIVVCLLVLALSVIGCSSEKELTNVAEYDGCTLELTGGKVETTDTGKEVLRVSATYTNSNSDPLYALCSFGVSLAATSATVLSPRRSLQCFAGPAALAPTALRRKARSAGKF